MRPARCWQSLDASQRTKAIITADAPGDMLTMANVNITPLSPTGLSSDAMNPAQRDLLMKLIDVYTGFMAADIAADRTARFKKAGVEKIGVRVGGRAPSKGRSTTIAFRGRRS